MSYEEMDYSKYFKAMERKKTLIWKIGTVFHYLIYSALWLVEAFFILGIIYRLYICEWETSRDIIDVGIMGSLIFFGLSYAFYYVIKGYQWLRKYFAGAYLDEGKIGLLKATGYGILAVILCAIAAVPIIAFYVLYGVLSFLNSLLDSDGSSSSSSGSSIFPSNFYHGTGGPAKWERYENFPHWKK